ncbi:hypothetical protein Tsubulata_025593 [Turnera subulata]|uniref:Filament-like plant protein 7 n=1 Tax=Turnera subulata TaxID=218843 RepID=A0A9Q0JC84_9ROSI|nr:hypothetical protein Tsubulata_025593 [Turnera subulata]
MDQKTWLWRKKSTEKIGVATEKVNVPEKNHEEEIQSLLADKEELENKLKNLTEKLASALSDCNAKEDLVKKHAKVAQEARLGREKAEAQIVSLTHELDETLHKRVASEERLTHLDAALKECMQQLRFVREEQEQRIHDAVMKTSKEFEKAQMMLEEQLADTNKKLAKISAENTNLTKALLSKEKLIEDLSKQRAQLEAEFNALMVRLESTEKDNASLKYEVRVLEKELEIRNEEREFNRRTADASHKQHLESVKKIAKLESECQRLRLLVRKRLPGPAALAKMKSEVEMLGRDSVDMRRSRSNSSSSGLVVEYATDRSPETPSRKIKFLTEQLCIMEEENKNLKEVLSKKGNELQFSRAMYARTASKLSQVESHLDELSKGPTTLEPARNSFVSHDLSLASMSDIGSDDKASCAESWASALMSELEHFKQGKQRSSLSGKIVGAVDINLMDDFAEMEKLAIVLVDKQSGSPQSNASEVVSPLKSNLKDFSSGIAAGKEIILVSDSGLGESNQENKSNDKAPSWLRDILKVVLEKSRATQRGTEHILEDVRVALADMKLEGSAENVDTKESVKDTDASISSQIGGYIEWKSTDVDIDVEAASDKNNKQLLSDLNKPMSRIIELLEGISLPYAHYSTSETVPRKDESFLSHKTMETHSGYLVRVFQWKIPELSAVLQQFVHTCYDLLNGKSDVDKFAQELCSALDWIMNHCFSLQDVSSMKDAMKKHFDWDETRSEGEADVGMIGQFSDSIWPMVAASNGHHKHLEKDVAHSSVGDENKRLINELLRIETSRKELEGKLQSATDESESLIKQLQESEKTIKALQKELETLRGSTAMAENQIENDKLMKEDLDTQLKVAKVELNEARQKFSSLEVELENKVSYCEELEATCLELQLQHESVTKKAIPDNKQQQEEKQLRTDWEITAASEKLAECQETILNLGKQLKALASPREAAMFNKVISTPPADDTNTTLVTEAPTSSEDVSSPKNKLMSQRSSLLDRMLAEDNAAEKDANKFPKIIGNPENSLSGPLGSSRVIDSLEKILILNGSKDQDSDVATRSLAIVPSKKRGGGSLWRKLLWGKKKSNSRKPPLSFAS